MSAGAAEGKCAIKIALDVLQHIQDAISRLSLQLVGLVVGFLVLLRIEAEDLDFDFHVYHLF
jgi:hypothetical protein